MESVGNIIGNVMDKVTGICAGCGAYIPATFDYYNRCGNFCAQCLADINKSLKTKKRFQHGIRKERH